MSEMVDRVARVIAGSAPDSEWAWGTTSIEVRAKEYFYDRARAVIAAMREPTRRIVDAVCFESNRYDVETCTDGTFMIVDGYRSVNVRGGLTAADEPHDIAGDLNGMAAWQKGIDAALGAAE